MRHFDKEKSLEILSELTSILQKHSIKYWLQDGTLLGYYREGDLLNHDNDVDIGLYWQDIHSKIVFEDIIALGFRLYKIKGHMHDSLMLTFTKHKQKIDLFFYYQNQDGTIYHTALGKHWEVVQYNYDFFTVKKVFLKGQHFFVPNNEEKFLEKKYGADWKIPKEKWDNISSTLNAKRTGKFLDINKCRKEFRTWLKK